VGRLKKILISVLTAVLTLLSTVSSVVYATDEDYNNYLTNRTYTVRIYAGAQGYFSDANGLVSDCIVKENVAPGTYSFNNLLGNVKYVDAYDLEGNKVDNKYYVKGVRESGKDNNTISQFYPIDRDLDLVVAYGIAGGDVEYTVKYVDDTTGKEIKDKAIFYGNDKEKIVVSCAYIEGYVPITALNISKTLDKNTDNTITFHYQPGDSSSYRFLDLGTTYTYTDNGTTIGGTTDNGITNLGGGTGNNAANNANGTQNAGNGAMDGDLIMIDDSVARENGGTGPATLLDLDDNSTPLADFGTNYDNNYQDEIATEIGVGQMPTAYKIGIGVAAAVAATGIGFLIYGIRKKKREEADG